MKKAWIIAGGVVVVLGVSAPWIVGQLTEQHWHQNTADFNDSQPLFVIETKSYQRGYLSSEITGQVIVEDPNSNESYPLSWRGDVTHGVTGSTIEFELADEQGSDQLEQIFPDAKPTLTATARAWGTALIELSIPAINYTDEATGESLNVSESYTALTVTDGGEQMQLNANWPGVVLRTPEMRTSLENFVWEQKMSLLTGSVWIGEARATLDKASFAGPAEELVVEELEMVNRTTTGNDGKNLDLEVDVTLDRYRMGGDPFGPNQFTFNVDGLNVAAYNELADALSEAQVAELESENDPQRAVERQMEASLAVTEAAQRMIAAGFESNAELDIASSEGSITATANLSYPGQGDGASTPMMMEILGGMKGELQVRVPSALADYDPAFAMQLMQLTQQGLLVAEGGEHRMDASFSDMQVTLNGKPMPLRMPAK